MQALTESFTSTQEKIISPTKTLEVENLHGSLTRLDNHVWKGLRLVRTPLENLISGNIFDLSSIDRQAKINKRDMPSPFSPSVKKMLTSCTHFEPLSILIYLVRKKRVHNEGPTVFTLVFTSSPQLTLKMNVHSVQVLTYSQNSN